VILFPSSLNGLIPYKHSFKLSSHIYLGQDCFKGIIGIELYPKIASLIQFSESFIL
jgi:hypothetical protein